ncbi:MAG: ATP-binding protein [Candidatus Berkelbacteria bacterium]|nr:ATP-binding protein [Candidatus Berkelbacteria bacterium]
MTESSMPMPNNAPQKVLEEVAREYEQTLIVPDKKPSPQWMLMPVGLVGAGKTTVVKPLAEHFGLIRISTDEIREQLKRRGYTYEGAREITHELQKKYLNLGYSIAIDANTGSPHGLEFNKKTKEEFPQVRMIFIHINPPEEFIVNKLKNYPHTWLFKNGEHAVERFRFHRKNFTLPDVPFIYTFDPSRDDIFEQLKRGIEAIENSLRAA